MHLLTQGGAKLVAARPLAAGLPSPRQSLVGLPSDPTLEPRQQLNPLKSIRVVELERRLAWQRVPTHLA